MEYPDPQRIATNGIELSVFSAGPIDGPPIVLCHGWPELAYSWRHQIPALARAGYHVIAPDQRGYGHSSRPPAVEDYDITHLTDDLMGLLDHYGHSDAVFVGHDWGAIVVWNLAMMQRERVRGVINLSVPFMERGSRPWVDFWEDMIGPDFYIVHFNRQPGVADSAFAANTENLLKNLYRTNQWQSPPVDLGPGMAMINMALADELPGELLMSESELDVFVTSFEHSGFTGGINWYRNFNRNWSLIGDLEQIVKQPALMIYGDHDMVPASPTLAQFVPNVEAVSLDCGHWIQQERPVETNALILDWLSRHFPS